MATERDFDFRAAIEKQIAAFEAAANAKDPGRLAAFYTDDATLMPPGSPMVEGRDGIRAFWQAFLDAGASDPKLRIVKVRVAGETAYEIGTWEANMPGPQGGVARTSGKYLVVWQRQSDGSVKMVADIFNANS
jgi:uncharacterized protein (TIGR02246 family)